MYSLKCILLSFTVPALSQQIQDIWQTTWDQSKLLSSVAPSSPIDFEPPGPIGSADVVINDNAKFQSIAGFGGSLTDSSALTLNNLKNKNSANYWNILGHMFSAADGADAAGLNYIRIPIGASDFSATAYSLDDSPGDISISQFMASKVPSSIYSVLRDIRSINSGVKIHLLPWSPPAWMKDSNTMNGGAMQSRYIDSHSTYLLKAVQAFEDQGLSIYAISIQNEVQNSNPTYPTCTMSLDVEGRIGVSLRSALDDNGLSAVKIIGYEHNWNNAGIYPVQLMQNYGDAFEGVAFHCYQGSVSDQDAFHAAVASKAIYFTECAGTIGSDWWSDIKWYIDNLWIGSLERNSRSGLMWNIALDGGGNPKLPGTDSCGGPGCRALVTINNDGSYSYNQEFYSMAQVSKAINPKDAGGPYGQRIGVSVGGSLGWALRVGAFVTGRTSSNDENRYSIVVLNWNDNAASSWNPQPVKATIEFRGMQATYTFPVGITTLWWFAPASGSRFASNVTAPPVSFIPSPSSGGPYDPNPIDAKQVKGSRSSIFHVEGVQILSSDARSTRRNSCGWPCALASMCAIYSSVLIVF